VLEVDQEAEDGLRQGEGDFKRITDLFEKVKDALTPKALKKFTGGGKKVADTRTFAQKVTDERAALPQSRKEIFGLQNTSKDKSLSENLGEVRKNVTEAIKEDYGKDFKEELAKEKRKNLGKKVDDKTGEVVDWLTESDDDVQASGRPVPPPPIFDQAASGKRISGSL
jgi:hypothetical protein